MPVSLLCVSVSLDSIVQDVRALQRGMEGTRREFSVEEENPVLQTFLSRNTELLDSLSVDGKTAQVSFTVESNLSHLQRPALLRCCCCVFQDAYESAVEYFGENPKSTPPSMFFPVFVRFIKAYKVRSDSK